MLATGNTAAETSLADHHRCRDRVLRPTWQKRSDGARLFPRTGGEDASEVADASVCRRVPKRSHQAAQRSS
jgi:hypothetical protein